MEWLNYHHLYYFWTVCREGSISRAARKLYLAQPTISTQLRSLEQALGEKLLEKQGRQVVPTAIGRLVAQYAEEIFSLGREMKEVVQGLPGRGALVLTAGISESIPKTVAFQLLQPLMGEPDPVRLVCREGSTDHLFADLAARSLDVLLTDAPLSPGSSLKAYAHKLGESGISFFASAPIAENCRSAFPECLQEHPLLLPDEGTSLRRNLEHWLEEHRLHVRVAGEFQDSGLMKIFGHRGAGIFAAPSYVEREIQEQYRVQVIGRSAEIRESFYVISPERRVKHPAVAKLLAHARRSLEKPSARRPKDQPSA